MLKYSRALFVTAFLFLGSAVAGEWRIVDKVTPATRDHALICHFWNATVFAPSENFTCNIGSIYAANLITGEIGYADNGYQGMPQSRDERVLQRDTLRQALRGDSLAKLDTLHKILKSEKEAAAVASSIKRERSRYLAAYEEANTLKTIQDFERTYADNDPDGLITKLASEKVIIEHNTYLEMHANSISSTQLQTFIDTYSDQDPDGLVIQARKRLTTIKKQEQLTQQTNEKKAREEVVKEKISSRKNTLNRDAERLKYIRGLHQKYANRITAESAEGYRIVSNFRIDCGADDGRVLPLIHALYASIDTLEHMGAKMKFYIQNRGSQVRIISNASQNGKPMGEQLYYEINQWGELHAHAIRQEAVLNACYGFQGSIWLMPGEPGYK